MAYDYDHPDDIQSDGSFVYVDTQALKRGSDELRAPGEGLIQAARLYRNFVDGLPEPPWGGTDEEFGRGAKKQLEPLMTDLPVLLEDMGVALNDSANQTERTNKSHITSNEEGAEVSQTFKDSMNDGGGGGRRG